MLATFAAASAATYQPSPPSLSRRAMLRATIGSGGLLVAAGAPSSALAADSTWAQSVGLLPKDREGLQAKWLEKVRILLQDEADAIQYGGQEGLAPGGPPSTVPALLLIPVVQMQAVLRELQPSLSDFSKWDQVMLVLERAPFETVALKRIFNAYADNIYYVSDSPEANAYLLGGATPSSKQTTQYLLRNEILKQLAELRDEIKYQKSIKPEERETEVAIEYMQNTLKAFDDYLKLSPADERATALEAVYDEKTAKGMLAALNEEPEPDPQPEPPIITEDVLKKLEELKNRLLKAQSKLTSAELAKQLAELQLLTHTSKLRRGFERDLEGAQAAARVAIAKATKEVDAAKAAQRVAENAAAARDVEVSELKGGLKRRDEQIKFLMQVHDASQNCEWIDTNAASTANDAQMAASLAASLQNTTTASSTANDAQMAASLAAALRMSDAGGPSWQGSPASVALAARRSASAAGPWQCGVCTLKNESTRTLCDACGSDRPAA